MCAIFAEFFLSSFSCLDPELPVYQAFHTPSPFAKVDLFSCGIDAALSAGVVIKINGEKEGTDNGRQEDIR
jgi:hypothetical protein